MARQLGAETVTDAQRASAMLSPTRGQSQGAQTVTDASRALKQKSFIRRDINQVDRGVSRSMRGGRR